MSLVSFAVGDVDGGPNSPTCHSMTSALSSTTLQAMVATILKLVEIMRQHLYCSSTCPSHLTEQERDKGLPVAVKELPVAAMPRGHVNADLRGAFQSRGQPRN